MLNSNVIKSIYAGGITFALCLVSMLAGGLTWLTGAAGWLVFLALALSGGVGLFAWRIINAAEAQRWQQERRDVIERMEDAQRCIKAEEQAHGRTKRELVDVRQQLTTAEFDAAAAKTEYENMRNRAAERGRTIKALEDRIASDNNTWREQVSAVREAAYKLAVHIEGSANGLPDEWQAWGAELAQDLRRLAGAGGVEHDDRQVTIEDAAAEHAARKPGQAMGPKQSAVVSDALDSLIADGVIGGKRAELPDPQTQPTSLHIAHQLMAKVRANQAVRRDNLDRLCAAIENGYELGEPITIAFHRGALWVSDELIANEIAAVKAWEVARHHANRAAQQQD